jgi:hypothetical protein
MQFLRAARPHKVLGRRGRGGALPGRPSRLAQSGVKVIAIARWIVWTAFSSVFSAGVSFGLLRSAASA